MHRQPSHAGLASLVQSRGRNGDTMLVHMSPEEVQGLHALALATGGMPSVNPDTGLYEFGWLSKLLPTIIGAVLTPLTGGLINPMTAGLLVGGVETIRTGDIGKGLLAGLGAYGGAGIGSSLFSAGAGATAANAAGAVADGGLTETIYGGLPETAAAKATGTAALRQMGAGVSNIFNNPATAGMQFARDVGIKNATMAAAPALAMNQTSNISSSNIPQAEFYVGSRFSQERNPKWRGDGSAPGEPYFIQKYTPGTFSKTYQSPEQTLAMANPAPTPAPSSSILNNPLDLQQQYPTFYGAEGGVIPRPNPSYPQAAITHSNYAAPFQYNRPQELIDGYEPKINPFTGEEKFADGGLASIPRDPRTTGPATMEQFMRENPQPSVNPLDPTGALKSYYTNMLNPENAPKAPSTSALEDYMRNLNLSLRGTTDASQIQKTKPTEPTRPTAQTTTTTPPTDQNIYLGDYGNMLGFNPMTMAFNPYAGSSSGKYQYDPVTKTYKNPAQIAAAQTTTPTVTPPVNPFVPSGGGMPTVDYGTSFMNLASGGTIEYAAGGKFLRGPGDGMSDDIRANIEGRQEARLADGEFVIPADVVSHLGNGSSEAGSRKLYGMMDRIRQARTGRKKQAPAVKTDKYLPA